MEFQFQLRKTERKREREREREKITWDKEDVEMVRTRENLVRFFQFSKSKSSKPRSIVPYLLPMSREHSIFDASNDTARWDK